MGKARRSTEFKNSSRVIDMDEARKKRQEKRESQRAVRKRRKVSEADKNEARGRRAIRKRRNRTRAIVVIFVLFISMAIILGGINLVKLLGEKKQVEADYKALVQQKKELELKIEDAKDKNNLEDLARQDLGLVDPGEVLYMFPADFGEDNKKNLEE